MEKTLIKITKIKEITDSQVLVVTESGADLKLPLSQVERFGNRVFIPTWLAERMGLNGQQ